MGGLFPSVPEETITTEPFQNEQKMRTVETAGGITCVELTFPNKSFLYNPQLCRKVETYESLPIMIFKRRMLLVVP